MVLLFFRNILPLNQILLKPDIIFQQQLLN